MELIIAFLFQSALQLRVNAKWGIWICSSSKPYMKSLQMVVLATPYTVSASGGSKKLQEIIFTLYSLPINIIINIHHVIQLTQRSCNQTAGIHLIAEEWMIKLVIVVRKIHFYITGLSFPNLLLWVTSSCTQN